MKKPINLKNICAAADDFTAKDRYVKSCESHPTRYINIEKLREELEQAQKAYAEAVSPVRSVLEEVQKRSTVRNITAEDILEAIEDIEKTFCVPKSKLDGVQAEIDVHAQRYPNAYKYTPESTQFTLENRRGVWYLIDVCRNRTGRRTRRIIITRFPDATKQAILDRCAAFD